MFKLAVLCQGVKARVLTGQSTSALAWRGAQIVGLLAGMSKSIVDDVIRSSLSSVKDDFSMGTVMAKL